MIKLLAKWRPVSVDFLEQKPGLVLPQVKIVGLRAVGMSSGHP
jgi:hypothetical protein